MTGMRQTGKSNSKHSIFLVDDHAMFREGMRMLIDREPDLMVCGEAAEAGEALSRIEELDPDMAIVDLSLSGRTGMDLIKTMKDQHDDLPVLVISMHEESLYAERALRVGADGFVMKQEPAKLLKEAIRKVLGGDIHLSKKMTTSLLGKFIRASQPEMASAPLKKLSNRELDVFRMLGQGKTTRHIAKDLGLKSVTINTFRHRIIKKLGFNNSAELVLQANKWTREGI